LKWCSFSESIRIGFATGKRDNSSLWEKRRAKYGPNGGNSSIGRPDPLNEEQKKEISPKLDFQIFVRELKNPETSSHYLASLIVEELEKRTPFRRAMRFRVEQVQNIPRIRGIRIQISGRLIGAEIARTEWTRKGQVPLHTISANLDYSAKAASTIYGLLGVKVWIFIT
jgi:ribosomal protein S3